MIRRLVDWARDDRAVVAPILALAIVPILGMFALGGEVAGWYMKQRQLQNVADSAALAAATNASTGYAAEATGLTTQYGVINNANGDVTVTKTNTATCPGTASNTCYQVTIVQKVPLYLTQMVGYTGAGTTMADGRKATLIRANSIASGKVAYNYCMIGLGTGANAGPGAGQNNISLNGNGGDYSSCAARSNGQVKCTSVDFGIIQAPNQQGNTCGSDFSTTGTTYTDPYISKGFTAKIAALVAAAPCATGALTGTITTTVTKICSSNNTMTGNLNIVGNGTDPPVLIIYNTTLNTAGFGITSTNGLNAQGATVIVTGPNTTGLPDWFSGDGPVSIQASNGGDYDDVAILVDPKYTSTNAFNPGGGSHVNLEVLGTIYAPSTDIVIQGSMDSTIGSYSCISIIAKSIYVNGGSMDNDPLNCKALGFNLDETTVIRSALVQ